MGSQKLITILGPTASGKTNVACQLAHKIGGEIISADSRQFYRGMDIGTGKDLDEFTIEGVAIPYHLIDICEAGDRYNIAQFEDEFLSIWKELRANGKPGILCGGSGMYLETALKGSTFHGIPADREFQNEIEALSDEEIASKYEGLDSAIKSKLPATTNRRKARALDIDRFLKANPDWKLREREDISAVIFGIDVNRNVRRERISKRLRYRLDNGMIEEVEGLINQGLSHDDLDWYGLEYKWVGAYLRKEVSMDVLFEKLEIAIHQFAKRQMTWFRGMEKKGYQINWISEELSMDDKLNEIQVILVKESES